MNIEVIEARGFMLQAVQRLSSAVGRHPPNEAALARVRDAIAEQVRVLGKIIEPD
jgi:hypothetical protein